MNILFLGGDKRYEYMIEALSKKHFVSSIGFDNLGNNINESNLKSLNLTDFDIVLFPITGINDKMEIKTLKGTVVLPEEPFYRLKYAKSCPIFFTGLKTNKLLELIPASQILSFLDYEEVKEINDELSIKGTLDYIKNMKNDVVCILGYGKLGKELYWRLLDSRYKNFYNFKTKRTYIS